MDEFSDVAKARASYKTFSEAMNSGRQILKRAGVPDPPPVPEFDIVYRRLDPATRQELFAQLRVTGEAAGQDAIRLWTPLIKRAFNPG